MDGVSIQNIIGYIAVLISVYFVTEATDLGLSVVSPWLVKNKGDRGVLAKLSRPGFEGTEGWLLAAFGLMLIVEPDLPEQHLRTIYGAAAVFFGGMIMRTLVAWIDFGEGTLARIVTWINALFSVATIFLLGMLSVSFLLNIGLGNFEIGSLLWSPFGMLCGLWGTLAIMTHGALFVAGKVTNPLAERGRALALVINLAAILIFASMLVSAFVLSLLPAETEQVFVILTGLSVLAYVAVFVLARMRKVMCALGMHYLAGILLFVAYVWAMYSALNYVEFTELAQNMVEIPGWCWLALAVAAVGSIASHVFKLMRSKLVSPKNHHWGST